LQLYPLKNAVLDGAARGGFVRKMKLGICMGRITGIFGGLCRRTHAGERADEEGKTHIAHPQGKNWLSRSPPGGPG
jgi:hypothetical protein